MAAMVILVCGVKRKLAAAELGVVRLTFVAVASAEERVPPALSVKWVGFGASEKAGFLCDFSGLYGLTGTAQKNLQRSTKNLTKYVDIVSQTANLSQLRH